MCLGDLVKNYGYLIKPASSLCNYGCSYCFYHDVADHREVRSSGIMTDEITNALISNALNVEDGSMITFAFQGGEPTLAGLPYFRKFVLQVEKEKKPQQKILYAIQTNGSMIDQEWCDFLFENKFLVGLSLDGYPKNHDLFRMTLQHQPTFDRVMESLSLLRDNHIDFNIMTVLTSELSKHPKELYDFYKAHDLRFVQLIPCRVWMVRMISMLLNLVSSFLSIKNSIHTGMRISNKAIISASHCLIISSRCFGGFHRSNAGCWGSVLLNMSLRRMAMCILEIFMY